MSHPKIKVIHFVTGGFSGATAVAKSLVVAANASAQFEALLVLRRKRHTPQDQLAKLQAEGIPFVVVPGWSHLATIWALARVCREFRPDVLAAHGFSDHIWGRLAGLWARVPKLIHVEHNSRERYSWWSLWLAKQLARHTAWIIGVSEGVRNRLVARGFPAQKCVFINNGIDLAPYQNRQIPDFAQRKPGIVMCARFARQKDHTTLLRALALLKADGLTPELLLVGGGKKSLRKKAEKLTQQLGLTDQVRFLGICHQVPELLMQYKMAVLCTHYEGLALVLIEGMAAGCFPVGSAVDGVAEWLGKISPEFIVPHGDAAAWAEKIRRCLLDQEYSAPLAVLARAQALEFFSRDAMCRQYEVYFSNN